jgi:hypothetical protein
MMDSTESPQQQSDATVTFTVRRSTRNRFLAKLILLLGLTAFGSHFFIQNAAKEYKKGRELTQEKYLARFDEYKGSLLNLKTYTNAPFSTFVMFIVVSFLIGSYELTALIIGLIIGKLIR